MKEIIEQRVAELSQEVHSLTEEKEAIAARNAEIEVRLHQLVGAIYELQRVTADLDRQLLGQAGRTSAEDPHLQETRPHAETSGPSKEPRKRRKGSKPE